MEEEGWLPDSRFVYTLLYNVRFLKSPKNHVSVFRNCLRVAQSDNRYKHAVEHICYNWFFAYIKTFYRFVAYIILAP